MHDFDATRIFWKEWRAQRSFWLGLLALAIGLEILLIFVAPLVRPTNWLEQLRFHEGLVVVLACSFATGSAAIAFAGEVEAKTKGLLQHVPIRARDLLAGKLTFSLAGSYALFVALWLVGSFLLSESRSKAVSRSLPFATAKEEFVRDLHVVRAREVADAEAKAEEFSIDTRVLRENLVSPLAFIVVGGLFSLLLSDVLLTVLIAGISTAVLLAIPIVRDSLPIQGTVVAAALVCDFLLARRWLVNVGAVEWRWLPTIGLPRVEFGRRDAIAEHSATLAAVRSPVAWRRAARSLLWKEFRQASLFCAAILVVGLVALAVTPFVEHAYWGKGSASLVRWVLCLAPLLPGVAAIRAERKEGAYQLLANHGITVDGFLACKHTVWLALSLFVFGMLLLVDGVLLGNSSPKAQAPSLWRTALNIAGDTFGTATPDAAAGILVAVVHIVLLYALGFLLALLLPGPIVAVFIGVLIELAVIFGWFIVAQLQIPFWWTIGAVPLILLAVGWVRTSDWVIGRGGSAWWKVAAVFFVPIAAMAAATVVYRVLEIPAVAFPQAAYQQAVGNVVPDVTNPSLFLEALHELSGPPPAFVSSSEKTVMSAGWSVATPELKTWVEQNANAVKHAIAASRQPSASLPIHDRSEVGTRGSGGADFDQLSSLTQLLLNTARMRESENRLDDAFACYFAVARLGDDAAKSNPNFPLIFANYHSAVALEWMQRWASSPQQSTERIKKAIVEFESFEPKAASGPADVLRSWHADRRELHQAIWNPASSDAKNRSVCQLWWVRFLLPWELVRMERLEDATFAENWHEATAVADDLRDHGFVPMSTERIERWSRRQIPPWKFVSTTLYPPESVQMPFLSPEYGINRLATVRMRLIGLALADFKRVHHQFPDTLGDLVPLYFRELPVDPWTDADFFYEKQGLPMELASRNDRLDPKRPFLASAGIYDSRLVRRLTTTEGAPALEVVSRFAPSEPRQNQGPLQYPGPTVALP